MNAVLTGQLPLAGSGPVGGRQFGLALGVEAALNLARR
jgi:hypothetical protein